MNASNVDPLLLMKRGSSRHILLYSVFLFCNLSCLLYSFGGLLIVVTDRHYLLLVFISFFTFLSTMTGIVRGSKGPGISIVETCDQRGSIFIWLFIVTQSIFCYAVMTCLVV